MPRRSASPCSTSSWLIPELNLVRAVLQAYRSRYEQIRDAVLETEVSFDEVPLTSIPLDELLVHPVVLIADRWRTNAS